jgi:DNA primase
MGRQGAVKAIEKALEWVCSFDRVNIWFDNDEPGKAAAKAVADILPPGKAYIVRADLKDANEYTEGRPGRGHRQPDLARRAPQARRHRSRRRDHAGEP